MGISIVQQKQLISTFTFCKMIKKDFPDTHITLGGNIVTRIRDVLPEKDNLFQYFDSAVVYEGENAFLKLIDAIENKSSFSAQGTLPREHFLLYLDRFGKDALSGKKPLAKDKVLCKA